MTAPGAPTIQQGAEQKRIAGSIEREYAIQNPTPPEPVLPQEVTTRAEKGFDLLLRRRALIKHVDEDLFLVPANEAGPKRRYRVHYGAHREDCTCPDYQAHRGEIACKHLQCVGLMFAARRRVYSTCQVCGKSSREKALVGRRGDRSRRGERWCLSHHPEYGSISDDVTIGQMVLDEDTAEEVEEFATLPLPSVRHEMLIAKGGEA